MLVDGGCEQWIWTLASSSISQDVAMPSLRCHVGLHCQAGVAQMCAPSGSPLVFAFSLLALVRRPCAFVGHMCTCTHANCCELCSARIHWMHAMFPCKDVALPHQSSFCTALSTALGDAGTMLQHLDVLRGVQVRSPASSKIFMILNRPIGCSSVSIPLASCAQGWHGKCTGREVTIEKGAKYKAERKRMA